MFGSIRGSADSKALVKDLSVTTEIAETINRTVVYYVGGIAGGSALGFTREARQTPGLGL